MTANTPYRASTFKVETSPTAWAQALGALPNAHPLQSWTWAQFKSRWGWDAIPCLLTVAENSWNPLAAAMILKRPVPRLPYSILYAPKGPILDYNDGALRRVVLSELENIARQEKAIFLKIDPNVVKSWGLDAERPSPIGGKFSKELAQRGWRPSAEQIQFPNTVEIDLRQSEDEILAAMKQKTRYNIRLAERKEVHIHHGTPADFPAIVQMYQETAVRDGFSIRPVEYYLDAWQSFYDAGMAHPLIAAYEGKPIAAVVLIKFDQTVTYMYGASTNEERNRMPTYLLQWEAIRWAKAQGAHIYDMWGAPTEFAETDPLWGVWRFKQGFNGQVVRHIGAWDYVNKPFWYWLYTNALPRYTNYLRSRSVKS